MIDPKLVAQLHRRANAGRWRVPLDQFADALATSVARSFSGQQAGTREVERYVNALHLEDLALACACAAGDDEAWEHFIREQRPGLYRAADALEPGGGARDLADSLYGELFGLREGQGERRSLFRYFHGRSSLSTWLRAVLSQRYVDRVRLTRRLETLPEEDAPDALTTPERSSSPDRSRHLRLIQQMMAAVLSSLPARDRVRLACYYAQGLTLAETGRALGEHEATVSRQLARARKVIRAEVERRLRVEAGMGGAEIDQCFATVVEDPGTLDLRQMLDHPDERRDGRKESTRDRSK